MKLITTIFIVALFLLGCGKSSKDEEMRYLCSDVSTEELTEITAQLKKGNYKYKIRENGSALNVKAKQYYHIIMSLAIEGISTDKIITTNNMINTTDIATTAKLRRALEKELTKTICSINEIQDARVHILLAKNPLFCTTPSKPKAAIKVTLKDNSSLSKAQISGISLLVASSVEGLTKDNIYIFDQTGSLLSEFIKGTITDLDISKHKQWEASLEKYLTRKVENQLISILGPGSCYVRVYVDLGYEQMETYLDTIQPAEGVTSYEIRNMPEEILKEKEPVRILSISIAINSVTETENGTLYYRDRSPEELNAYSELIQRNGWYYAERGDSITIVALNFNIFDKRSFFTKK